MTTMDFFGHQRRAQSASKWLVLLFVAAVAGIIACVYLAAAAVFAVGAGAGLWQPELLLGVAAAVIGVVVIAMLFKTGQLAAGGGKVAAMLGGTRVEPGTADAQEQRLHNVVEEMAIASGIPVPEVWVLRGERGLNAFAAGWGTKDAAIAVTQGLLEALDRDELQGVIAHEFSHVFHGDMRLNIRLMGVLFGIVCIATIGRIIVQVTGRGGSRNKNAGAIVLFGIALLVIGWLGVFFARLIQAAVSRQREFLADASAVQYTRNPQGIGLALAKIGGLGARMTNAHTEEASHMMFADGVRRLAGGAFATHPPLTARIERVLPGFTAELRKGDGSLTAAALAVAPPPQAAGFAGGADVAGFIASVGAPDAANVRAARSLLADLPLDIVGAAREPQRAGELVLGLLLDPDVRRRGDQLAALAAGDRDAVRAAELHAATLARVPHRSRLPLLELAIGALRGLPAAERGALLARARALAAADGTITPFEFALLKTLERHLPGAAPRPGRAGRPGSLLQHLDAAATVLSTLAWAGAGGDEARAREAFAAGWNALATGRPGELRPPALGAIAELEPSLGQLATVSVLGKRNLLTACAAAAAADGVIAPDESDLLRALAELWGCPVPLPATASIAD